MSQPILAFKLLGSTQKAMAIKAAAEERAKRSMLVYDWTVNTRTEIIRREMQQAAGQDVINRAHGAGRAAGQQDMIQAQQAEAALQFADPSLQNDYERASQTTQAQAQAAPQAAAPAEQQAQPRRPRSGARPKSSGGGTATEVQAKVPGLAPSEEGLSPEAQAAIMRGDEPPAVEGTPSSIERPARKPIPSAEQLQEAYFDRFARKTNAGKALTAAGSRHLAVARNVENRVIPDRASPDVGKMGHQVLTDPWTFFSTDGKRARDMDDAGLVRMQDEELGYPEFGTVADKEEWKYRSNHAELYERNWNAKGYTNNIRSQMFGDIILRNKEDVRNTKTTVHKEMREKITATTKNISDLNEAAKLLEETTTRSFIGHRYDPVEKEWVFVPTDVSQMKAQKRLKEIIDGLAIQWIKGKDPAGRLSDQDFTRAIEAMGHIATKGWDSFADILETLAGGGQISQVRQAMIGSLKVWLATRNVHSSTRSGNDTIQSVSGWRMTRERALDDRRFFLNRYIEQGIDPPNTFETTFEYPTE